MSRRHRRSSAGRSWSAKNSLAVARSGSRCRKPLRPAPCAARQSLLETPRPDHEADKRVQRTRDRKPHDLQLSMRTKNLCPRSSTASQSAQGYEKGWQPGSATAPRRSPSIPLWARR